MTEIDLLFCFKGKRSYITGADIYNVATRVLSEHIGAELSSIDLLLTQLTAVNLVGMLYPAPPYPSSKGAVARLGFEAGGFSFLLTLYETDKPVDCRLPFNEEEILIGAVLNNEQRSITLLNETEYTGIEIVVALNKQLLRSVFPEEPRKWLFTRLVLDNQFPAATGNEFHLRVTQALGTRLVRSEINIDGARAGQVFFSVEDG